MNHCIVCFLFSRLQAVMCIISTIMESCPSTSSFYSTAAAKTQHNGMNNIIRLFLKKGLVNDLARVPHSLDLSRYILIQFFSDAFPLYIRADDITKIVLLNSRKLLLHIYLCHTKSVSNSTFYFALVPTWPTLLMLPWNLWKHYHALLTSPVVCLEAKEAPAKTKQNMTQWALPGIPTVTLRIKVPMRVRYASRI